ncbi:hypothetical protein K2173_027751 [Erythroxylum novogranatense]|uniref:Uncharacterized protein n=1 Tax=Erythroxylum novogranatense TaxID=1862640 RepID=A0AAV8U364_9ROSI|nr:hypothetical protein K2173_027751 [Erythroxylum novogranatense]
MELPHVQIVSQEAIKPSAPTPPHLRTFKLPILAQLACSPYAPTILYYPMNKDSGHIDLHRRLEILKKSLAITLTHFYPLAGRLKSELLIDCNDEGAKYVETRVSCHLSDFLNQANIVLVHDRLLPYSFYSEEPVAGAYVTNIQVNVFECGGIAIGACISHRILDGAAFCTFFKGWSANARGVKETLNPNFTATSLFPANDDDLWLRDASLKMWTSTLKKGHSITNRFVFNDSAISNLKNQATGSTRIEVVTAFLCKCFIEASEQRNGFKKPCSFTHFVNLRKRMEPSLSENSVGNLLWIAHEACMEETKPEMEDLVRKVRKAISVIDADFVKKLMTGKEGYGLMSESIKNIAELCSRDNIDHVWFSSWSRLGYYEADFGWGKPLWVSCIGFGGPVAVNVIILNDTRFGNGIEALVTLDQEVMATLEDKTDILNYAVLNPSPSATA